MPLRKLLPYNFFTIAIMYVAICICLQLYFTGEKGEPCVSSKSDIWAGCVAMMKALVGKNANDEAKIQVSNSKYIYTQLSQLFSVDRRVF